MSERSRTDGAGAVAEVGVVVVGAGLAGLTAAVTAARAGASVVLVDAARPGGRARTSTAGPGVVLNAGPRALYVGGAASAELSALGVRWSGGVPPVAGGRARRDGVVHRMPGGVGDLLRTRLLGVVGKVRVAALLGTIGRKDPAALVGRSVTSWVDELGLDHATAQLLHAIVRLATYVDDPDALDAGAALAQLQLALGDGVQYLDGGWQVLVDELVGLAAAAGVELVDHCPVRSIATVDGHGTWELTTAGRRVRARSVVLASGTPAAAAGLCPVQLAIDGVGPPVTAACLELGLRGSPPVRFLLGVDQPLYLSEHAPPAQLAPDGVSVVHVLRYGVGGADEDRAALWDHAEAAGVDRAAVLVERFLRRMVVMGGAPLAGAGGLAGRPPVRVDGAAGLFLAGDWVGDRGLLADAAVASGVTAGRAAAARATAAAPAGGAALAGAAGSAGRTGSGCRS